MPAYDLVIAFFLAAAVFAYVPGPAMLYASAQTIARGQRAGWMAVFGIHIGGYVHVAMAALGLAVLFTIVPLLFTVLKLVGAAYLCWLGFKLIVARDTLTGHNHQIASTSPRRAFRDSVIVEVLNPKTAIFFLAFLPQFTDASAALPISAQLLILGTIVNLMFSSADVVCVVLADRLTRWLRESTTANRIAQRIGGGLLVVLGINLATQER
jgi:threonine/homoserine/homoserine lactone efflux protein